MRAATPSNAAEIAVPDQSEVMDSYRAADIRVRQAVTQYLKLRRRRLDDLSGRRVLQDPKFYIDDKRLLLDHSQDMICAAMQRRLSKNRERFGRLAAALDALSPLKVLGRGYAIARREDGVLVKDASDVMPGDRITVRLKKDEVRCVVE